MVRIREKKKQLWEIEPTRITLQSVSISINASSITKIVFLVEFDDERSQQSRNQFFMKKRASKFWVTGHLILVCYSLYILLYSLWKLHLDLTVLDYFSIHSENSVYVHAYTLDAYVSEWWWWHVKLYYYSMGLAIT